MSGELLGIAAVLLVAIVGGLWTVYTRLDAKLDAMRDESTTRRHAFRNEIQAKIGSIDEDLARHADRITRLERNGSGH